MSHCGLDATRVETDRAPASRKVGAGAVWHPAAMLRPAEVLGFSLNHKPQLDFPASALPQSRSYQLPNQMKEENPDGVIYVVNQKKEAAALYYTREKSWCLPISGVILGFMSSPYDET